MGRANNPTGWGQAPWLIDFEPKACLLPDEVDIAILGGGFTGLAGAAWLRRRAPEKTVVVLEARRIGHGASGRTGGIALGGTAAGDLPGLGDVLGGFKSILRELEVDCDLMLPGAWEIAHNEARAHSSIEWQDLGAGVLRVMDEVPGGTVDPGKLVSGLARAAERLGAIISQYTPVSDVAFGEPMKLAVPKGRLCASQTLFASNAEILELSGLAGRTQPKFALAVATAPLEPSQLELVGLGERKPFYTVDLPYLWGRVMSNNGVVWGSGLLHPKDWRELESIDVGSGEAVQLFAELEQRVRGLHRELRSVEFTHRWGGPILFARAWRPTFAQHPRSPNALVLGGYSGHGVALSVYLACWAAEVLLGRKTLPRWGAIPA